VRSAAGDSALVYALVLGAFHYINRIADLLHVDPEFLPEPLLRFEWLRKLGVLVGSRALALMDLAPKPYGDSYEVACTRIEPIYHAAIGRDPRADLEVLRARPAMVDVLRLSLEERDRNSSLSREKTATIHRLVEQALPRGIEDAEGFHPRPADPFEAFVFVGTRYAARVTPEMIESLRSSGFDDLAILDLAHAIADANQWARTWRLLGLPSDVLSGAGHPREQ
jgi:hypothetical protein